MRLIKSKNSEAELIVFRFLRKEKVYFQKHYKHAPGTPDIALPRKRKAVFIDGDFWHGKRLAKTIERRGPDDYWVKKVERNIERDREQEATLIENGWRFIRIWESDLKRKSTQIDTLEKIKLFIVS